jgi:predicted AlkP superfamily pyrophosphatase or phosphodiesterase
MHRSRKRISNHVLDRVLQLGILTLALAIASYGQAIAPVITVDHGPNAPQQIAKPYVILVSLDGFRYDYARKYHADHLLAMATEGASAPEGMLPSYPSITFPNHYTIVTGLYPEHHGIVANSFYDAERKGTYSYHDSKSVGDGTWYGGTPLWVLAEQQGMRSASFYWVGSEADIQGVRPTYYLKFDAKFPNQKRVEQVVAWLHLPPEQRPHMITLYFSDTDSAGHRFGPDSTEVADAVHELDSEIGRLMDGVKESKLPVDLIVLADHGMIDVKDTPIHLDQFGLDPALFAQIVGPSVYPKSDEDAQKAYEAMRGKSDKFDVFRRSQAPAHLHFDSNPREGDPVVVPTGPYFITATTDPHAEEHIPQAEHGYDAVCMPEMRAIFFAVGPDIRPGIKLEPFENVSVYPMIAKILGLDIRNLKTGPIDGKLGVLEEVLKTK